MRLNTTLRSCVLLAVLVPLVGCNTAPRRDPEFAVSLPAAHPGPQHQQSANGSIFQYGHDLAFFEDIKARRIGDILTVRLTENHNASKTADTEIDRTQSSTIENPTILGTTPQFDVPGVLPLADTTDLTLQSSLSSDHAFEGEADSQLSNSLSGNITVTVADVLPNGNLLVRGEKRLNLNQGNEYIKIAGIVRPVDIAADNTVPSTKIADATIIYNGDGATADANRPGWLTRFFLSAASPF
ncbi:MAG: flagellar basal body L-ring protein FlgH [Gammaproteobacteria bacterium]